MPKVLARGHPQTATDVAVMALQSYRTLNTGNME